MREIKMLYYGKVLTFQIVYECPDYIFCECREEPKARGFYTRKYIDANKQQ